MEKKQIRTIFFYELKLGQKAAEATRNFNDVFGPGTTNERTVQRWFQKFRSGGESLEDEEGRGRMSEFDKEHLRATVEGNLHTTVLELA